VKLLRRSIQVLCSFFGLFFSLLEVEDRHGRKHGRAYAEDGLASMKNSEKEWHI